MLANPEPHLGRWVRATFGGWCLGVVIVALLATIEEQAHIEGQFPLGLGMGLGVGVAQWRAGRKWFAVSIAWTAAAIVGMSAPFVVSDLMGWMEASEQWLAPVAAIGGLFTGMWQRELLRRLSRRANWWVLVSTVSWLLAVATLDLMQVGRLGESALLSIAIIAFGGVVLGVATGVALLWMLPRSPNAALAPGATGS